VSGQTGGFYKSVGKYGAAQQAFASLGRFLLRLDLTLPPIRRALHSLTVVRPAPGGTVRLRLQ
jgi:hypothetical protein